MRMLKKERGKKVKQKVFRKSSFLAVSSEGARSLINITTREQCLRIQSPASYPLIRSFSKQIANMYRVKQTVNKKKKKDERISRL